MPLISLDFFLWCREPSIYEKIARYLLQNSPGLNGRPPPSRKGIPPSRPYAESLLHTTVVFPGIIEPHAVTLELSLLVRSGTLVFFVSGFAVLSPLCLGEKFLDALPRGSVIPANTVDVTLRANLNASTIEGGFT